MAEALTDLTTVVILGVVATLIGHVVIQIMPRLWRKSQELIQEAKLREIPYRAILRRLIEPSSLTLSARYLLREGWETIEMLAFLVTWYMVAMAVIVVGVQLLPTTSDEAGLVLVVMLLLFIPASMYTLLKVLPRV